MKRIAEALDVSRCQLYERVGAKSKPRGFYRKAEDADILPDIQRLAAERPTYGYRRIAALLNRERENNVLALVNQKRVHRIMRLNALTLQKHTARRSGRVHDGKVAVMASNIRWRSDALEFACWNGEIVRMASRQMLAFARTSSTPLIAKSLLSPP